MSDPYSNPELCRQCGGKCCQMAPGAIFPEEIGSRENLLAVLSMKRYAIDWWEGDPRGMGHTDMSAAYFLRPAVAGMEGRIYHGAWGGACTFLSPDGCTLEYAARPLGCRVLEPKLVDGEPQCLVHDCSKRDAALAWLPFQAWFDYRG